MIRFLTLIIVTALLGACQPQERPIEFGEEACSYCHMTIVDNRYAAQLVTSTGKVHSFDAVECLLNYKHEHSDNKWAMQRVCNYKNPGALMPAGEAYYVISKALPSPMGANITPVAPRKKAEALQEKHSGKLYDYSALQNNFQQTPKP